MRPACARAAGAYAALGPSFPSDRGDAAKWAEFVRASAVDAHRTEACTALVREVLENISHDRPLAYTTVLTVLDNLHSKGLVQREKVGKAYAYAPVSSREEHTAAMLQEVLAESDDRTAALMHLVGRMESEEAAELLAALTERADESS